MIKLRWHLLFLLIATTAALGVAAWLAQPIWIADGYELVRYAGKNADRSELYSLAFSNDQQDLSMETHDWRTGRLLRKTHLEVKGHWGYHHYLNASDEGESSNAPMLFTRHWPGFRTACFLLDPKTGRLLEHAPITEWCLDEKLARHKNQLALALKSEVRLFRDKSDPGRSIPLPGVRKVSFSPDGTSLLCVGNDSLLYLVDVPSGEVTKLTGCDKRTFDASFLKNGQLLVITGKDGGGPISQLGLYITRWQREGSTLHQICPRAMLRTDETITLGVPIPVGFQEKDDGTLQIELYQGTGWPDGLVHALTWLENRGYSLEKWFPKKTFLLCYELNPSNQIVSTYKRWFDQLIKLEGGISVGYQPDWQAGKTIAVFNTRRIWPWALAVGVVVYAGLWRVANVKKKSKQCHPA